MYKISSAVLFVGIFLFIIPRTVSAAVYYIDPDGNNANSGTAVSSPWRDFTNINSRTLLPGDKVLLKRGGMWNQELIINGKGTADNFIEINAYGAGPRPHIRRNFNIADRAMRINTPSYMKISSLEVSRGGAGIVVFFDKTIGNRSVYFNDILSHHFHGVDKGAGVNAANPNWSSYTSPDRVAFSFGIGITGLDTAGQETKTVIYDYRITNSEIYKTVKGTSLDWYDHKSSTTNGSIGFEKYRDLWYDNVYLHDNDWADLSNASLHIPNCANCTFTNVTIDRGSGGNPRGTSGVFIGEANPLTADKSVFDNLKVLNTPLSYANDNVGIDFECCGDKNIIRNSWFENNAGGAITFLSNGGTAHNIEFYNSVFINNGWAKKYPNQGQITVSNWPGPNRPTGNIHDNWYVNPSGVLFLGGDGDKSGLTQSNNTAANPPAWPQIEITSPRKQAVVTGSFLNVAYTAKNLPADASQILYSIDGGLSQAENKDGSIAFSGLAEGFHSVKIWAAKSTGEQVGWPGIAAFTVTNDTGAFCGNGRIDSGEKCDDGNIGNWDGCSTSCRVELNIHDKLIAGYGFEESSGNELMDITDNFRMWSSPGTRVTGKYGKGMNFGSGQSAVTDGYFMSITPSEALTLEAWLNPNNTTGGSVINKVSGASTMYDLSVNPGAGTLTYKIGNQTLTSAGGIIKTNQWQHVAGVYDGRGNFKLYVNGNTAGSKTGTPSVTSGSGNNLTIGKFGGILDDVRIYKAARTDTQINSDMNTQLGEEGVSGTITPPAVSGTPPQNGSTLLLTVFLHGIGRGGDNVNLSSTGNMNPLRLQRNVTVELTDTGSQTITKQGIILFNNTSGNFTGSLNAGSLTNGSYIMKISSPQYLTKIIPGIVTVTGGQSLSIPAVSLTTGDTTLDNRLNILDYNVILDCYADLGTPRNCTDTTKKQNSDLTDDSYVNQFDYNLFLRELSVQSGQ